MTDDELPPKPGVGASFRDDDFNFKKLIVTPQEPIDIIKDTTDNKLYEVPRYTSTMTLGNLNPDQESAMRIDLHMFNVLSRMGFNGVAKEQLRNVTDRIISSQSRDGKLLAAVTEQRFYMKREGYESGSNEEEENRNPIQKIMDSLKGTQQKTQQKVNETQARFR